jgi:hypothetical protein
MPPSIAAAEGKAFLRDGPQVGPGKYDDYSLLSVLTSRTMGRSLKHPGSSNPLLKRRSSKSALQEGVDFADLERELREVRLDQPDTMLWKERCSMPLQSVEGSS